MLMRVMQENVFRLLAEKALMRQVNVVETRAVKGKPSQRSGGGGRVWTIEVELENGQKEALESSRGGLREWASLDNLNRWLATLGVVTYSVHGPGSQSASMQRHLELHMATSEKQR
jgi:hypothetical protein